MNKTQQEKNKNNVSAALNALFRWLPKGFRFRRRFIVKKKAENTESIHPKVAGETLNTLVKARWNFILLLVVLI